MAGREAGGLTAVGAGLRPEETGRRGPLGAAAKRAIDLAFAALALTALAPLFAFLAALVLVDSGRPIFHGRRVLGRGGVSFEARKFRTMRPPGPAPMAPLVDGPEACGLDIPSGTLTAQGDPRITGVGRWLRRFSLDELPQLFNVLRGEMSLVGPRMLAPEEHAGLGAFPEWQRSVLAVKPGITGLWQVSGRRLLPYEERARLDLEYVRGATVWTDLRILLRTIPAVVTGRGAF